MTKHQEWRRSSRDRDGCSASQGESAFTHLHGIGIVGSAAIDRTKMDKQVLSQTVHASAREMRQLAGPAIEFGRGELRR